MADTHSFRIDVGEIIRSKAPSAYRKTPAFAIRWLAQLIRQDEVNEILTLYGDTSGVDFMTNTMNHLKVKLKIEGIENLPESPSIFASNHPLGGMDGICLASFIGNHYRHNIKYLVNDILYYLEPLKPIFIPVNKHGAQGRSAAVALNEALASDCQIITFPAGLCSRKSGGRIIDLEWKKMFITKSVEHRRDVVPVFFNGRNSNLFYNIANIRKALHINFNVEMLFLPREFFNAKGSTFTVRFGKPIPWQTFDATRTPSEWAQYVKQKVYDIAL